MNFQVGTFSGSPGTFDGKTRKLYIMNSAVSDLI